LPLFNGVEATRQIRARLPNTEALIFTVHDSQILIREVLEAGARAYVVKSEANKYLIAAVESLVNHKAFLAGHVSEELLTSY
jgi:DNA-binding NarL/FixJ family response regulator